MNLPSKEISNTANKFLCSLGTEKWAISLFVDKNEDTLLHILQICMHVKHYNGLQQSVSITKIIIKPMKFFQFKGNGLK